MFSLASNNSIIVSILIMSKNFIKCENRHKKFSDWIQCFEFSDWLVQDKHDKDYIISFLTNASTRPVQLSNQCCVPKENPLESKRENVVIFLSARRTDWTTKPVLSLRFSDWPISIHNLV